MEVPAKEVVSQHAKLPCRIGYVSPYSEGRSTWVFFAAQKFAANGLGEESELRGGYNTHKAVCEALGNGVIQYGVVAIENIIDGPVIESLRAVEHHASEHGISPAAAATRGT